MANRKTVSTLAAGVAALVLGSGSVSMAETSAPDDGICAASEDGGCVTVDDVRIATSDATPVYAGAGADGRLGRLLPSGERAFPAVSSSLLKDNGKAYISDDVVVLRIASDGDNGFLVTVLDRFNGVERTVRFPSDSFVPFEDHGGRYEVNVTEGLNSYRFRLYSWQGDFDDAERTDGSPWHEYATVFELAERNSGLSALFVFGARTPAAGMPDRGTAEYHGSLRIMALSADLSERYSYRGNLSLEAQFANGSVSGTVDGMKSRISDGSWSDMSPDNRMDILDGTIANGQFAADWAGHGPEGNPLDTVRDFSGAIVGVFHGPDAEEIAGILNGRRGATSSGPAQVASGYFEADRGDGFWEYSSDFSGREAPVYARSGAAGLLASLLPAGDNTFPAASGAFFEDDGSGEAGTSDDLAVLHIASDGNNGFRVTVMDKVNSTEHTVHFPEDSFVANDDGVGGRYEVNVTEGLNSYRFRLYSRQGDFHDAERTDGSPWHEYATAFELGESRSGLSALFAFGAQTPVGGLPYAGTAVYRGWLGMRSFNTDLSDQYYYGGDLHLEASFSDGTVSGTVDGMGSSSQGGSWSFSDMPEGNRIYIRSGRIANGGFAADWEGVGPTGEPVDTMRGFVGTVTGIFHGPEAEELAGLLEGRREATPSDPAQVAIGQFIAGRDDAVLPEGNAAGLASLLGRLLPAGDRVFPAVSSSLLEDDGSGEAGTSDELAVLHIASDGNNGFRVTVLDRVSSTEHTIHFPEDSFIPFDDGVGGKYEVNVTEGRHSYRYGLYSLKGDFDDAERTDGSPRHAYATAFKLEGNDIGLSSAFTFGVQTPEGGMPNIGTAIYRGQLNMESFNTDLSDEYIYKGHLRLKANFTDGSVSGKVDEMKSRAGGGSWSDISPENRIDILNGRIADSRLAADWEGHGPIGGPADTMRGFAGTVSGIFHGPEAEEISGVLEGRREATFGGPAQVAQGQFVAEFGDAVFASVSDATASALDPVHAVDGGGSLYDSAGIDFGVHSVSKVRDFRNIRDRITEPIARSAEVRSVAPDGDGGFTVAYVIDGSEHRVHFDRNQNGQGFESSASGGDEYELYAFGGSFKKGRYHSTFSASVDDLHCDDCYFGAYLSTGLETPPDVLRSLGRAHYDGSFWAELYPEGGARSRNRRQIYGDLALQADFSEGRISGLVERIEMRAAEVESPDGDWAYLPESNSITVLDGEIDDSRFQAKWKGRDSDRTSDIDRSLRGFAGGISGAFFGPNGEEVGGTVGGGRDAGATSPEWHVMGAITGSRAGTE